MSTNTAAAIEMLRRLLSIEESAACRPRALLGDQQHALCVDVALDLAGAARSVVPRQRMRSKS